MRKWVLALGVLMLAGCSAESADQGQKDKQDNQAEESGKDSGAVEVDKGLMNVEVTIPATFLKVKKTWSKSFGMLKKKG